MLVSRCPEAMVGFTTCLTALDDIRLTRVTSAAQALDEVERESPDLVVVDERIEDLAGPELIRRLVAKDFRINTAVVSSRTQEDFQAAYKGLGTYGLVPSRPDRSHAQELLRRLKAKATAPLPAQQG